jgi:hypothetical protein
MRYKIKYFKDTRCLVAHISGITFVAKTLLGLIETVEAYKASLNK